MLRIGHVHSYEQWKAIKEIKLGGSRMGACIGDVKFTFLKGHWLQFIQWLEGARMSHMKDGNLG